MRGPSHLRVLDRPERRWFALAMLVNAVGNGVFLTVTALFFTRVAHVPLSTYGVTLTVAAACGLLVGPAVGHQADRLGPRALYVALLVLQGLGTAVYLFTSATVVVLAALVFVTICERGAAATRGTFTAALVPRQGRVEFRAVVRSVVNAAAAVGAAAGALVLAWDTPAAFRAAAAANAVTFLVAAFCLSRCELHRPPAPAPAPAPAPGPAGSGTPLPRRASGALRNPGFLSVTALNAVLALHASMLTVALPLWIAQRTDAPLWTVSVVVLVNTVGVVVLQVRASRGAVDVPSAARVGRRAAVALAAACVLLAATSSTSGPATFGLLAAVAVSHLGGELWQAASAWSLSFELAPEESVGQYQGVFNSGQDVGMLVAPVVFTYLVAHLGAPGWVAVAIVFCATGLLLPPVSRWALARRERTTGAGVSAVARP